MTPIPVEGRVFVPSRLGLGVLFMGFGCAAAYGLYDRFESGLRIPIMGILVAAFLPVAGIVALARAYARGCKTCNAPLTFRGYRYPVTMLAYLRGELARGGPALDTFRRAPADASGEAARLKIEACARCERLAFVRIDHERFGDSYKLVEAGVERRLADHETWLVQALGAERPSDVA